MKTIIVLSLTASSTIGLRGYGNAGWAVSQAWHTMGDEADDGFGVRQARDSNHGRTPFFGSVSLKRHRGQLRLNF